MLSRSRCAHCKLKFTPEEKARGFAVHPGCISQYAQQAAAKLAKKRAAKARQQRASEAREIRARKAALLGVRQLKPIAQKAFNDYIRERDAGRPCISCGANPVRVGFHGGRDAGHYRSRGAADHLRYDERNCHAQCVHCNQHLAGNIVQYRIGLIERIGLEEVVRLESDNSVHKWTRDELIGIRDTYRRKLKELKACAT